MFGSIAPQSNSEKFAQMLELDKLVYANIVQSRALIAEARAHITNYRNGERSLYKNATEANEAIRIFNEKIEPFNALLRSYLARQNDYRNNTTYKIGNAITESTDMAINYLKGVWANITGDSTDTALGAAPILVPVAVVAGASITAIAVGFFVTKHFDNTTVDYNKSLEVIKELSKTDPRLAEKMLTELNRAQKQQSNTGFFNQIGKGVKYGLIGLTVVGGGYLVYEHTNLFKK